jgi:hypothetical protein
MKYRFIDIDNLEEIQKAVLKKIPVDLLTKNDLFYIKNSIKFFLDIPEIKTLLDKLGFTKHIHDNGIAVNVTMPGVELPIHYDSDKFIYSFNIPLLNYENTYVNFWETDSPATDFPRIHPIYKTTVITKAFDRKKCKLTDQIEPLRPCVINTHLPHNVSNKTDKIRVMLLVRLANSANELFD